MNFSKKKIQAIIIMGPPGSGKSLLAKTLAETGEYFHLCVGDMFKNINPESHLGQLFYKYSTFGYLMPDKYIMQQFKQYLHGIIETHQFDPETQILILDGLPKTEEQAKELKLLLDVKSVNMLNISDIDELFKRVEHRGIIEKRLDDQDREKFKRKMQTFKNESDRSISLYPETIIHQINAHQKPLNVLKDFIFKNT